MKTVSFFAIIPGIFLIVNGEGSDENKTLTYKPDELLAEIFNPSQARQGGYGLIKFDDQNQDRVPQGPPGTIKFDEQINDPYQKGNIVTFQDDNQIGNQKKRRRRRRKPKNQGYGFAPTPALGFYGGQDPNFNQQYPGVGLVPQGFSNSGYNPYFIPGYPQNQLHRPPRRPRPSFTSEALSSITEALTSIALYDDYQCVPRLLCEAASGGALGTAGFLQSAAGLQPLLTLLAAYNGISSSPLFIFGRAVFLGMTSKSNPGTCRYAYSQCPNDPEQLVHYLNNHNGGFFRFFNAPQQQQQQNLQQFYNQLTLQQNPGQNFGLLHNQSPNEAQSFYGLYQNHQLQQIMNQQSQYGFHNPNQYDNHQYGNGYPSYGLFQKEYGKVNQNKLEKRIQNNPYNVIDNVHQDKFSFPDNNDNNDNNFREENLFIDNYRGGKEFLFPENPKLNQNNIAIDFNDLREGGKLKFPSHEVSKYDDPVKFHRKKNSFFPDPESNRQYINYYNYPPLVNYNDFRQDIRDLNVNNSDEGVELVYVIRGNGNPNNPEVIKLRPGQKVE